MKIYRFSCLSRLPSDGWEVLHPDPVHISEYVQAKQFVSTKFKHFRSSCFRDLGLPVGELDVQLAPYLIPDAGQTMERP